MGDIIRIRIQIRLLKGPNIHIRPKTENQCGVYTIVHVRRTPVRHTCRPTPYMYDSVNNSCCVRLLYLLYSFDHSIDYHSRRDTFRYEGIAICECDSRYRSPCSVDRKSQVDKLQNEHTTTMQPIGVMLSCIYKEHWTNNVGRRRGGGR